MLQWGHGDEAVEELGRRVAWCTTRTRFNGAKAMKPWKRADRGNDLLEVRCTQWGHGDEAVEEFPRRSWACPRPSSFNGATAMKPWKRATIDAGWHANVAFNGATAMKPWKRPVSRTLWSKGPRTGFARGSTRGGVKPIACSGDEVVKAEGNELSAQREALQGVFELTS